MGVEDGGKRPVSIREKRLSVQADAVIFQTESLCSVACLFENGRIGKSYIVADADDCRNSECGTGNSQPASHRGRETPMLRLGKSLFLRSNANDNTSVPPALSPMNTTSFGEAPVFKRAA